jgi:chemotaxis response regulator CheB
VIRIGVVDDTATIRMLVRRVLSNDERFEVVGEACDGLEALRLVDDAAPDVLLLDLAMPNMDGLEVLVHLRATDHSPIVVVLSGFTDGAEEAARNLGAAAFINKATNVRELPTLVAGVVENATLAS